MAFRFIDPGPLIDRELELVSPAERWADGMIEAASHPYTIAISPKDSEVTREQLVHYIREFPLGRQPVNTAKNLVPAYAFWMRLRPEFSPAVPMAGGLSLRIGHTMNLETYIGHIGYTVYPPARGNHYAERAVRLILPLAKRHGMESLWITCNPENAASRRTCERLGAVMVDIVDLPMDHNLYQKGERKKCRFRLAL